MKIEVPKNSSLISFSELKKSFPIKNYQMLINYLNLFSDISEHRSLHQKVDKGFWRFLHFHFLWFEHNQRLRNLSHFKLYQTSFRLPLLMSSHKSSNTYSEFNRCLSSIVTFEINQLLSVFSFNRTQLELLSCSNLTKFSVLFKYRIILLYWITFTYRRIQMFLKKPF